jgi:general secretion pathway protein D
MNKLLNLFLVAIFVLASACSHQTKSSPDRFQKTGDLVDAMRLPPQKAKASRSTKNKPSPRTIEIRAGDAPPNQQTKKPLVKLAEEVIDKNQLRNIPAKSEVKAVKISGNNVPLRQGPGPKFKKLGIASKGQTFELLRVKSSPSTGTPWYFVRNNINQKFFVSALLSSVQENQKETTPATYTRPDKEVLQKKETVSPGHFRTTFDPAPPLPKSLIKAKHITLNFEGTEVYDVITTFCELLEIDYLIEGNIKGKVTLQTFNEIPVRDLYVVLEQILALHNIAVIKRGSFYRFVPAKDAGKKPLGIYYGNDPLIPPQERMIIQIIPLKYVSAKSMKKILTPLLTQNAVFIDVPETENIMLVEMAINVKRILQMVEALDIDKLASSDIQLFNLNHADSETVVAELEEVFSSMGYAESLGNSLNFLSLTRMNSILVVNAFERILPSIEFWIKKLDQPISEGDSSTFVYYIQNGDATAMSGLLNEIFQSQNDSSKKPDNGPKVKKLYDDADNKLQKLNPKKENKENKENNDKPKPKKTASIQTQGGIADNFQGEIAIIPDPDTNSLVIRTNPRNYTPLLALIKKLDLFPQQVLIEVLIIDVTLDAATREGLEWVLQGSKGGKTFIGGVNQTPATLGSAIGGATASLLQPGGSLVVNDPSSLIVQLQAFASDSKANILANPILVTSNNKAAGISIVDEIPVQSTTLTSAGAANPVTQTNIEYRSVGIKLNIFPKINSDSYVNLQIDQEVSSQGPDIQTVPSFRTEELHTEVVLKDNQVLVMGGLMRTDTLISNEGIPVLRNIPWLGKLFSTDTETSKKTELMIFITPHVISNDKDSNFITKQFQRRLGSFKTDLDQS